MKICFIVNNPKTQKPTYTTAHLALSAVRRGHEVFLVGVNELTLRETLVCGNAVKPKKSASMGAFISELKEAPTSHEILSGCDLVFLRNNTSEGAGLLSKGSIALEVGRLFRSQGARVVNDPDGLARAQSKLYLTSFPSEIRPKTLISRDVAELKKFLQELDRAAIVKPVSGFGGEDVFYIRRKQSTNLNQILSVVCREGYAVAQEFLPEAKNGDKRLLLLNGEPIRWGSSPEDVAMYRRMRPKGDFRNNIHIGGRRCRALFTEVEQRLVERMRPKLVEDGLTLVGVDIVGDKLLEVNVFAPGGVHNISELCKVNVADQIIARFESCAETTKLQEASKA